MKWKQGFLICGALVALGCGGHPVNGASSELVGNWQASPAPGLPPVNGLIASSSFQLTLKEDETFQTAFAAVYTSDSLVYAGCTKTDRASGGTWSVMTGTKAIVLAGTQTDTTERAGCKLATDNQTVTPSNTNLQLGVGALPYELSGTVLTLHFANGPVSLSRQ